MRKTYYDCMYFKRTGNVFGGCKHPDATEACLYEYTDECRIGKSRKDNNITIKCSGQAGSAIPAVDKDRVPACN